jgi:hypothetical protein
MRMGHPPLPRGAIYRRVITGLTNWYSDTNFSQPAKAITSDDLLTIRAKINLNSFADARAWCASIFAFYGVLRVKEYTSSGLLVQHVQLHSWGINLMIPFSKTALIPASVAIVRRDDTLCPVLAYHAYTSLLPLRYRQPHHPFFLHHPHSDIPLDTHTFIRHIRIWILRYLHDDPSEYSGHSFRRGGTTALQLAGVPESTIAAHGRWKSLAYRAYFDVQHNLRLRLSATAQLSLFDASRRQEPSS